ncbi:MAG TPA: hypothetical protein VK675_02005 [Candidatus Paceibacterota bacterium]|nr:hypothetical protein [Candidatus Paceibacterota bacterium]
MNEEGLGLGNINSSEKEPDKSYRERKTVGNTQISVAWDSDYDDYNIFFPQIKTGDEATKNGVYDQVIRIGESPKLAKQVFDYAAKLAETEHDLYKLYKAVESFARTLDN